MRSSVIRNADQARRFGEFLAAQAETRAIAVEWRPYQRPKTISQNAGFWWLCEQWAAQAAEAGAPIPRGKDGVHDLVLSARYGGDVLVYRLTLPGLPVQEFRWPEPVQTLTQPRKLSRPEMRDLIDFMYASAADADVFLPELKSELRRAMEGE